MCSSGFRWLIYKLIFIFSIHKKWTQFIKKKSIKLLFKKKLTWVDITYIEADYYATSVSLSLSLSLSLTHTHTYILFSLCFFLYLLLWKLIAEN